MIFKNHFFSIDFVYLFQTTINVIFHKMLPTARIVQYVCCPNVKICLNLLILFQPRSQVHVPSLSAISAKMLRLISTCYRQVSLPGRILCKWMLQRQLCCMCSLLHCSHKPIPSYIYFHLKKIQAASNQVTTYLSCRFNF